MKEKIEKLLIDFSLESHNGKCPSSSEYASEILALFNTEEIRGKIAVIIGESQWKDSFYGKYVTDYDRSKCREVARDILSFLCPDRKQEVCPEKES